MNTNKNTKSISIASFAFILSLSFVTPTFADDASLCNKRLWEESILTTQEVTKMANPDRVCRYGYFAYVSLIHLAALHSDPKIIQMLLNKGASVDVRAEARKAAKAIDGATPLHFAIWYNDNPEITKLLLNAGADANAPLAHVHRTTPLGAAAESNTNSEVIKLLLDAGAEVNPDVVPNKATPLYRAVRYNSNPEVTRLLLRAGADIHAPFPTPLLYATNSQAIRELLLKAGVKEPRPPSLDNCAGGEPEWPSDCDDNDSFAAFGDAPERDF